MVESGKKKRRKKPFQIWIKDKEPLSGPNIPKEGVTR
jgi:hypothetical protein